MEITSIGPGKLYKINEDGSTTFIADVKPSLISHEEFIRMRRMCKYQHFSYAGDDHTRLVETCRHPDNIPLGCSWGMCELLSCPFRCKGG